MDKKVRHEYYKHSQGLDSWHISPVKGNMPPLTMNDGPCGVRKPAQDDFNNQSGVMEAIATLSPSAIAASFSKDVAYSNGVILSQDCIKKHVDILLAPGVNIKRSSLCGRNFEYFSEDPCLSGTLAAHYINGLQDNGVRACVKHFCANNKELARKCCSSDVSLRALNEVYLRSFSYVFNNSKPFSIMTSYNKVNGEYVPESDYLLNKKLKQEFAFKGLVMSDWCAVNNKAKTIHNGLHVEMPIAYRSNEYLDNELLQEHFLEEDLLRNDEEFYNSIVSFNKKINDKKLSNDELHALCENNANEVPVLIKNEDYLPIKKGEKVLFIGYSVSRAVICGDGSASVNPSYKKTFLDILYDNGVCFDYIRASDENERVTTSKEELSRYVDKVDKVVLFLNDFLGDEAEAKDREHISLRSSQLEVFKMVKEIFPKFACVLICGSVYDIEDIYTSSSSMLISYYSGEGQHEAIYNCLYGLANPSGRLPETWISSLTQNPLYERMLNHDIYHEYYDEDIYVGYKYYLEHKNGFILPFGYGLSYSSFSYSNFDIEVKEDKLLICLSITNNSDVDGKDVIQIYVGKRDSGVYRVKKELKVFDKVFVKAHQSVDAKLDISIAELAIYDEISDTLKVEKGTYQIYLSKDSFTEVDMKNVVIDGYELKGGTSPKKLNRYEVEDTKFALDSPCEQVMKYGVSTLNKFLEKYNDIQKAKLVEIMQWNVGMPINELQWFDIITFDEILALIDYYNSLGDK